MEYPELSLGLSYTHLATKKTIDLNSPSKKRKVQVKNMNLNKEVAFSSCMVETENDQTFNSENCKQQWHDLQFGRAHSLNRNSAMNKGSCSHGKAPNLDLELNSSSSEGRRSRDDDFIQQTSALNSGSANMIAMGCFKCNQLVMLSKTFPSCPNCKYVHTLLMKRLSQQRANAKSFKTLSLLK